VSQTSAAASWFVFYQQALLETHPDAILGRIHLARASIRARQQVLPPPSADERSRLEDGLRNLSIVEREYPALPTSIRPTKYVTLSSADHRWLGLSESVCELLGYTHGELVGRPARDFVAPEYADRTQKYFEQLKRDGTFEGRHAVICRDGSKAAFTFKARVFPDGAIIAYWFMDENEGMTGVPPA
jgi:PAS domain S-box-containing protein